MDKENASGISIIRLPCLVLFTLLFVVSCGGDGDDGPTGAEGPQGPTGPQGSPGNSTPLPIPQELTINFTGAEVTDDGTLTVTFLAKNENGHPYWGLPESQSRFTLAQLAMPDSGEPTKWQSYINKVENAPDLDAGKGDGTDNQFQATYERGGIYTDNGDGSYQYEFVTNLQSVSEPLAVSYDPTLTHRVAIQVSGGAFPVENATYDWQPSTGSTEGIATRNMVTEETCNGACHGDLAIHGGGRVELNYCVTCHNPGSVDANTGNTVDFRVMVHKIHQGADLSEPYMIYGYRDSLHDYSDVHLPMDTRNCTSCHSADIAGTPDGDNWLDYPTIESCGSCHDQIDWTLAYNENDPTTHSGGAQANNAQCAACHAPGTSLDIAANHIGVMNKFAVAKETVEVNVNSVDIDTTSGDITAIIQMLLDDNLVDSAALSDGGWADVRLGKYPYARTDNGGLAINWDSGRGFKVNHVEINLNDCVDIADGQLSCSKSEAFPGISESDTVTVTTVDLFACVNNSSGNVTTDDCEETRGHTMVPSTATQLAINPQYFTFNANGSVSDDPYHKVGASLDACMGCHVDQTFHHGASEIVQCKTCHNATRDSRTNRGPGDLKYRVHSLHSGLDGLPALDGETEVSSVDHYPNEIAQCTACHTDGQYDIPLVQNDRPSAGDSNDRIYISPTVTVCSSCHLAAPLDQVDPSMPDLMKASANYALSGKEKALIDHMLNNGGIFASPTFTGADKIESCAVCHSIGQEYGVDKVHGVDD